MPSAALSNWRARLSRAAITLAALFAFSPPAAAGEHGAAPGAFDFYVLSLSWSPSYCVAEGAEANQQQCSRERPFAFVVHGLWPQYESGYPEYCPTRHPGRVPQRLTDANLDIMPSAGLIGHQWRKHGSCSGLTQAEYLSLTRKAREQIAIPAELERLNVPLIVTPEEVEALFMAANPGLAGTGIAVTCDRRRLREVRICLSRDLEFRSCEEVDRAECRVPRVQMPPLRGR